MIFNSKKKKKIGLALGGGAALGAAHIGVLKAIDEFDIPVHYVAGTSIGAFVGAFYAFGKTWQEIEDFARDLDWFDVSRLSLSKYGLLSNKKMNSLFRKILGDVTFEDAKIPLAMVAVDICTGQKAILKSGNIATAVMASTCIPGVFIPVDSEDKLLVDGGIMENVPVATVSEMGAKTIIGVDLLGRHAYKKPGNIVDILINTINISIENSTKLQTGDGNIIIAPDLSAYNIIDTDQTDGLIEAGYTEARKVLNHHFG
ncbi:patatin [candidate division KSB1 bacterium]|nr:patatin [candidate division KSB1 bacterium]